MVKYTATELEKSFKKVARIRQGKEYKRDDGYWTGGKCDWGGGHNLREDCQTFANGFNKISNLRDIKEELKKCTSKSEYDAKKNNYIRQCEEALSGLNTNTSSSYIFGVCCIWSDADPKKTVESKIKVCREELQNIKKALEKEDYKWVQELKELESEINEINRRMEENKRKAISETDPLKKAALIQLIEEDGNLLQQKYAKKKELSNRLNFDPAKKVQDIIESMKKAIEKAGRGGGSRREPGTSRNPNNSDTSSDSESSDYSDIDDNNVNLPGARKKKKETPQHWFQENKQLIIIAGLALLVIFYLYSQKDKTENYSPSI